MFFLKKRKCGGHVKKCVLFQETYVLGSIHPYPMIYAHFTVLHYPIRVRNWGKEETQSEGVCP